MSMWLVFPTSSALLPFASRNAEITKNKIIVKLRKLFFAKEVKEDLVLLTEQYLCCLYTLNRTVTEA